MKHLLNDISAAEISERLLKGQLPLMIDVRETIEYHTFNIGGENIPLSSLPEKIKNLGYEKDQEIIVICQRGIRSETAQHLMIASGFSNVRNLTGGLLAYRKLINS